MGTRGRLLYSVAIRAGTQPEARAGLASSRPVTRGHLLLPGPCSESFARGKFRLHCSAVQAGAVTGAAPAAGTGKHTTLTVPRLYSSVPQRSAELRTTQAKLHSNSAVRYSSPRRRRGRCKLSERGFPLSTATNFAVAQRHVTFWSEIPTFCSEGTCWHNAYIMVPANALAGKMSGRPQGHLGRPGSTRTLSLMGH